MLDANNVSNCGGFDQLTNSSVLRLMVVMSFVRVCHIFCKSLSYPIVFDLLDLQVDAFEFGLLETQARDTWFCLERSPQGFLDFLC